LHEANFAAKLGFWCDIFIEVCWGRVALSHQDLARFAKPCKVLMARRACCIAEKKKHFAQAENNRLAAAKITGLQYAV